MQIKDSKSQEIIETLESNCSNNKRGGDNLSPRSKEKNRIIKLIRVSFNKLKEAPKTSAEFYRIGKMLGKGAFGRVNLAIHKLTDYLVAVKSINK
jgi:serine/threonine protein kinase